MKWYFHPYKKGSESYRNLRRELSLDNVSTIYEKNPEKFRKRRKKIGVINWGSSSIEQDILDKSDVVLNNPDSVGVVSNKLRFFEALTDEDYDPDVQNFQEYLPQYATSKEEALRRIPFPIVCRTVLNGHSGAGIVIANNADEVVEAPLYTRYIKKKHEFRIHMFKGCEEVFIQQKKRMHDCEEPNWQIRNFSNGFTYAEPTEDVCENFVERCREMMEYIGLDFCAFDVIYQSRTDSWYVLEINSAAGIQGSTLEYYTRMFEEVMND